MVEAGSSNNGLVEIEVAYAKSDEQVIIVLTVAQETTVGQAVKLSGLLVRFPEISSSELKLGIFGAACKPEQGVKQGDRIEIYRPLLHDPKEIRRQRALRK